MNDELVDRLIKAVRAAPTITKEYMCHDEPHVSSMTDYDALRKTFVEILNDSCSAGGRG